MESRVLQVAASFTATPLTRALRPLLVKAGIAEELAFAQYAQMAEYMLGEAAASPNIAGTLVMLRVEDWLRETGKSGVVEVDTARRKLRAGVEDFVPQLGALERHGKPVWFLACPSVGWISEKCNLDGLCRTHMNLVAARVRNLRQVFTLNWPAAVRAEEISDRNADRLGQIPFSAEGFRRIAEFVGEQMGRTFTASARNSVPTTASGSGELAAYLAGLGVKVRLFPASKQEREHVDRLLRTAAAFSLTGEEPDISEAEVDAALESENCVLVAVSDRLSDYGASGLVRFRCASNAMVVEALALSCPVLGKQVEWALLQGLAQIARARQCSKIVFEYRPSGRNELMRSFLGAIGGTESDGVYVVQAGDAEEKVRAGAVAPGTWALELPKYLPRPGGQ